MIDNTVVSLSEQVGSLDVLKLARRLSGDLRALILVYKSPEAVPPPLLKTTLKQLQTRLRAEKVKLTPKEEPAKKGNSGGTGKKESRPEDEASSSSKSDDCVNKKQDSAKSDSDSEMQTSPAKSEETKEPPSPGPLDDLELLDKTINELIEIVEKDH
ncbi:unnamed protein product [Acanthoscelides obtectus]|nr:unnamed protein product [Acanthoscelides obtectus]CAK1676045.1 hypothetical protein AOBTE_LOCUS30561 [Acanthoscelides obtectus]